jgi:tetratricopeptide (TPR) repeat protein
MNEHGSSPLAGPGKLLLGDAYHGAGQTDSARVIYIQVAESHVNSPLGGEAHARLGNLAYEEGRYQDAIDQLELRREQATSVKGNEHVYLLLAKAHRAAGNPAEAEVVLRELIDFFPENPYTPEAYVELSQVLEERGMRQEALRLARRTALSYPGVPLVLRNEGELLSKAGIYAEAAEALVAAEAAGDKDPKLLLRAAQNYQQADDLAKASGVYEDLITRYAVTPEAFEGGIALAQVDYERGQLRKSLERLERLATVSEGKPQYLPVMKALGDLYSEIGLDTRAAQAYSRVAAVATEPETLARAAAALLTAGSVDEGMTVADRVDRTKVSAAQAYELLMRHGEALLRVDPDRALALMEEAYATYPEEHTPAWGQRLLDAYLTSDRSAYARRLVMDMEADARQNQAALPDLVRGAVAYGDYLYGRQDYRAAADAYALIPETADVESQDVEWSRFQRANALLQLGDFEGSIPLFDAVASAKGHWAKDAALKGKYGRLEQRMRGMTVTPAPGQMAQAAP